MNIWYVQTITWPNLIIGLERPFETELSLFVWLRAVENIKGSSIWMQHWSISGPIWQKYECNTSILFYTLKTATPASILKYIWVQGVFRVDTNMSASPLDDTFLIPYPSGDSVIYGPLVKWLKTLYRCCTHICVDIGCDVALIHVSKW